MSTRSHVPSGVGAAVTGAAQFLNAKPLAATLLPPPEETWRLRDAPAPVADIYGKLLDKDIIEVVESNSEPGRMSNLYRTRPEVHEWIDETIDPPATLDCGHAGIRNLGDGAFTCQRESCTIRVGREAAWEVLDG